MTAFKGLGTYGNAAGVVTPLDHKLAHTALVAKTATANVIRPGLFYNGTTTIVSGTANMSYNVAPYTCATQRSATAGVVIGGNDATYNVATTAAPGSNSRYDVIYHWHREYSIDGTDSNPVIGVVQGTAAASPSVPSLSAFPGAIELARVLVPAGVTATNSGTTITQTAPFTASASGLVVVRNATELAGSSPYAAASWVEGQRIRNLADDLEYVYNGSTVISAARAVGAGLIPIIPTSVAGSGVTLGTTGVITATAATTISMMGIGSADFDVIRIQFVGAGTAGANVTLRVRTGGSDVSGANYNHVAIETTLSSGPTRSATTSDTAGGAARMDNGQGSGWLEITNLFAATATTWQGASIDAAATHRTVAGRHTLATSYPDLTLLIGTGNFTGKIRVYGYNNG